ncbi:hypothetical protein [Pseudomonas sp. rhizo25]|uniref:hypothetical protein n=1 Tax=Pseudomonas sp. rhizo25 TaxID=3059675 RepID=UPI002890609E|nr:hypothetical protein [Pseudomonas sp. rhizo25]MDT3228113.1 hypothetical protein [Pseudomonas sp. rhizo25]
MRYLKIFAQDILDNDIPDVVYLEFYDDTCTPALAYKATAFDITDDGKLDWVMADDMNQDGIVDTFDRQMALEFAQLFLAFEWFSVDAPFDKYLKVFAGDFDNNGIPDTVRLHFHQGDGVARDDTLVYSAAVYSDGNGLGASVSIHQDVNNDGKVDRQDTELVKQFAARFLKFSWVDSEHC